MSTYTVMTRKVDGWPGYIVHCYRDGELVQMSAHFFLWSARLTSWVWRTSK